MRSQNLKSLLQEKRFPLSTILSDDSNYLLTQIAAEIPQKMPRNGSAIRIKTLKQLCELLAAQNKKLDVIHDLIVGLNKQK